MKNKILIIKSSSNKENSVSNLLIDFSKKFLSDKFKEINLSDNPPDYWSSEKVLSESHKTILEDVEASELIIIGTPMYNFGVPAQLKSWMDWVALAGRTFKYTEKGPEGLLKGKKALIVSTRGGVYEKSSIMEHQVSHLISFLSFLGIESVVVSAEGLAMGNSEKIIKNAKEELEKYFKNVY